MDILNSIPVLSEQNPVKPVTLEDIQRIHTSLTLENPLTFQIFLTKRPDLAESEKAIYMQIIERLRANEKFRYETTMAQMTLASLPSQPVTDIGGNVVYDA
jgi:hypothetical protein